MTSTLSRREGGSLGDEGGCGLGGGGGWKGKSSHPLGRDGWGGALRDRRRQGEAGNPPELRREERFHVCTCTR